MGNIRNKTSNYLAKFLRDNYKFFCRITGSLLGDLTTLVAENKLAEPIQFGQLRYVVSLLQNLGGSDLTEKDLVSIFSSEGFWYKEEKEVSLSDLLSRPEAPYVFPKAFSYFVREAAEEKYVLKDFLHEIPYSYGGAITFPCSGNLFAADIGEGCEYPERCFSMGGSDGAVITSTVGKSGLAVRISDEMIRYSQFGIILRHLQDAGRALAVHKEVKIANYIHALGVTCFNNEEPEYSLYGMTTGSNGRVSLKDITEAKAQVSVSWKPDTFLVHPLAWETIHFKNEITEELDVVISSQIGFNPRNKTTDMYVIDSNELGTLVVDEPICTEEFDNPRIDIRKIKIRERYGIAIEHEGQQIGSLLNVSV